MRFAELIENLTTEQRLHFYEVLAHNLTVVVRGIWSDAASADADKVERMKWVNEVLHRVTAKVCVLRLKTHEWTEPDFEDMLLGYMQSQPGIASDIESAVQKSYRIVTAEDMR
jgi:hypothetical protein